jgi:dTDP-4-amino-4,6-dideoxygalactose transaminase
LQGVSKIHIIGPSGPRSDEAGPIYLRFPLLAADERLRDDLYAALQRAGIGAGKLYGRSMADFFAAHVTGSYPGAEAVARRLLTLPTHGYVTQRDVERMVQIIYTLPDTYS